MRSTYFVLSFAALLSVGGVAHAKSRTIATDVVAPTTVPIVEPTPLPTIAPTPLPTVAPTPLPTAEPTPLPTAVPTPLPTEVPTPVSTPTPVATPPAEVPPFQPVLSAPSPTIQNFQIPSGPRSDVSVGTPVTGQQVQQAALALTAPPSPSDEQQRMLLNVASHTASSTLADPSSDYSYGMFSGLNRSTTFGLDSLAVILAAVGIYVAVRSGSTMNV